MIAGTDVQTTVADILDAANNKRDYVIPSTALRMTDTQTLLWPGAAGTVNPSDHAHGQIADYLQIPRRFYDRLRNDAPDLITVNVNRLLDEKKGEARMVRTLHGQGRAILSDRYRRLDHEDIAEHLLPEILGNSQFQVHSMRVTESKFYMQVVTPRLEGEFTVGDPVQFGWILQNSEIGLGSLSIQALVFRLRCKNGMIAPDFSQRKAHLGARLTAEGDDLLALSDETQKATDKALWMQIRDYLDGINTPEGFQRVLASLQEKAADPVQGDPQAVVKELGNRFSLREDEQKSVLYSFLRENDSTRWGLANAVTELANENRSYDRAVELEKIGGEVMALDGAAWNGIAKAGR